LWESSLQGFRPAAELQIGELAERLGTAGHSG
jgi:hypothetical protein